MTKKVRKEYKPIVTYNCELKRWEVESETYKGHKYCVKYNYGYERLVCSCPWGRGQAMKNKKDCKHVLAVMNWIEQQPSEIRKNLI